MKKYKIVNRNRFITFVTVMLLVVTFSVSGVINLINASTNSNKEVIEIQVEYGDTIWGIAKEYGNSTKDIREVVYDICELNNIKASDLKAGQVLLVPLD